MLRVVASFFSLKTKPITSNEENSQETFVREINTEIENVSNPVDMQSHRQKKQQELIQKILLRKISHQAVMNHYAQDHIPLSQVQKKLEEDNLPLIALQEKLKDRDNISINTTTKENIKFLLYNKSPSRRLLIKPRKLKPKNNSKETLDTTNDRPPTPKDDRDYDVWDDAMIGHLMNLIDTVDIEAI
jgi:hypothetical protein